MSILQTYAMRKLIESQLNGGIEGIRKHENDLRSLLRDLSDDHLSLYIEVLELTGYIAQEEQDRRNK